MMHANNGQVTPKTQAVTGDLQDICNDLDTLSSTAWLIYASTSSEAYSTESIGSVSRDLCYRIAELAEKLEAIINGGAA
jgi:hypothetical protein